MAKCAKYWHFSNTTSQEDYHNSITMDPENLKGSSSIWFKFVLESYVIIENFWPTCSSKSIYFLLVQSNASITNCSCCTRIVCQSVRQWILRNVSQENISPPGMACNIFETMKYKACMAVARTLSTSNTTWQHIWGGWESNVFNIDTTVWCICL